MGFGSIAQYVFVMHVLLVSYWRVTAIHYRASTVAVSLHNMRPYSIHACITLYREQQIELRSPAL